MQIEIQLIQQDQSLLGFDYLYALHSALMRKMSEINPELVDAFHNGKHQNKIKMFAFSPLSSFPKPRLCQIENEKRKQMLLGSRTWFRIASPIPEFLNCMGEALLKSIVVNLNSKMFNIRNINMIAPPDFKEEMIWFPFGQSASICTTWSQKEQNEKQFIYPDSEFPVTPNCKDILIKNLIHKFRRLQEIRPDIAEAWLKDSQIETIDAIKMSIDFIPLSKEKLYKPVATKGKHTFIRSWRCPIKITAPPPIQRLIWSSGLGSMNSQGYGLMEECKQC